jgi:hypothetical protein
MERVVITVEALRCHQCKRPLHPQELFYQRQMKTAVEVGSETGTVVRYERVVLCAQCEQLEVEHEQDERNRAWWSRLWTIATIAGLIASACVPAGILPLYAAIVLRIAWKWWAKQRPKSALSQADQKRVI